MILVKMFFFFFLSQLPFLPAAPPCCWGCGMSLCGRKALTLLSSVFAVCGLGLLGIAVSTDYWLYLEEGVILPLNQSTEIRMSLHSGLWRVCFLAGELARSLKDSDDINQNVYDKVFKARRSRCFILVRISFLSRQRWSFLTYWWRLICLYSLVNTGLSRQPFRCSYMTKIEVTF